MKRSLSLLVACLLILAGGYVHGLWTDRWTVAEEPAAAVARYAGIPMDLGDWHGEAVTGVPAPADAAGDVQRRYVNRRTGQTVIIALVGGRPGPVSIHTPEACYVASGYVVGTPTRVAGPQQNSEFWTTNAVRARATEETRLRLFWAWNAGAGWVAPDSPRQRFAPYPVLHKLYVLRELNTGADTTKEEPCQAFLKEFLPPLDRALFPPVAPGSASAPRS